MPTFSSLIALAAALATTSASSVTFQNAGAKDICYMAELSSGTFPSSIPCGPGTGISIIAGQKTTVDLDPSFNGALTAWTNGARTRGARYEINFAVTAGSTWYDADYQLGMSDGTVGPSDNRKLDDGRLSLAGEPDTLAKANAAWPQTENQDALLEFPAYLKLGGDGRLGFVYCDADAPQVVIDFFQVTAEFSAYVAAGSGGSDAADKMADENSLEVGMQDMLIVAH